MRLNDRARVAMTSSPFRNALVEFSGSKLLGGIGGESNRLDCQARNKKSDQTDRGDQEQRANQQRLLHEVESLLHVAHVVDEVELILPGGRHFKDAADESPGSTPTVD